MFMLRIYSFEFNEPLMHRLVNLKYPYIGSMLKKRGHNPDRTFVYFILDVG
jgi:hypothetical protein